MAFDENNGSGMVMPVAPMAGGYGGNGFGNFGGDWGWIILLLLLCGGGWGNGFGGFGGFGSFAADGAALYPWMNQAEITTGGFQNAATNSAISGLQSAVTSGFGDVQLGIAGVNQNICQTGNGITAAIGNGFSGAEIAANARQMAILQQLFGIQSAQQQCCCDTRAGIADLRYTVATEACADRAAVSDGIRDILTSQTANTQRILDQLCQDKIDAKNETIAQLRQELSMRDLAASQNAQTAAIRAGQAAEIDAMYNRLVQCPIPCQPVYGSQPIFTCSGNGCGCGG